MVVVPDTIRVRKQAKAPDEWGAPVYLDEWEDVGAAHFRMDEERFREALVDVYKDWITVFRAPAAFRARLTLRSGAVAKEKEARRRRMETVQQWLGERCVVDPAVEERSSVLVADCRAWHEERGLDNVAAPTVIGRVVQQHAVGTQRTVAGNVTLGVALKGA